MKIANSNNLNDRTKIYRELYDQIIVEVKNTPLEEHEEPFKGWLEKNRILLEDVEKLKKNNNNRYKILAFLLETQFIEFQLIDLLQELKLVSDTNPDIIKFVGKKQTEELYKFTLGQLYRELYKYKSGFLKNLKPLIEKLNTERIRFAHYLFTSIKGINEVINEAKNGLAHNKKVFKELYNVFEYIKKRTWYGQMYERKRVNKI